MKPILFNTEMVKAILEGRKTVTRRVVKEKGWDITGQPKWANGEFWFNVCMKNKEENAKTATCHLLKPPYEVGDVLYVRETWRKFCAVEKRWLNGESFTCDEHFGFQYKAGEGIKYDDYFIPFEDEFNSIEYTFDRKWKPSIHMPKEAARIFLRVTNVRVERLQQITNEGVCREGVTPKWYAGGCKCSAYEPECMNEPCENRAAYERMCHETPFLELWNSTIKPSDICKYGWDANPYVWVIEFERCDKPEEHK